MDNIPPLAHFRLLRDFKPRGDLDVVLDDLRKQLAAVPAFEGIELTREGNSTVLAALPASNKRQMDRMRELLDRSIEGWKVIDASNYRLPTTF